MSDIDDLLLREYDENCPLQVPAKRKETRMMLHVVYCPHCPAGMVRPLYTCASRETTRRVQLVHAERHLGHHANPKHVGRRAAKEVTPDPVADLFARLDPDSRGLL